MSPRQKPYTKKVLVLDTVLFLLTGGAWIVIVALRELWYRAK